MGIEDAFLAAVAGWTAGALRLRPNRSAAVHGAVQVDAQHPRHFVFEDGARFFPLGYECDWLWALDATNPALPKLTRFLHKLAANGFNYILLNAYAHDTAWDVIRPDDTPPGYAWFHHLREFFEGTGYWRLQPADELVSQGFCLAEPGREYIVFQNQPAPFTLKVEGLSSPAKAQWFHPFTGQRRPAGTVGNGSQQFAPPGYWGSVPLVLHVRRNPEQ